MRPRARTPGRCPPHPPSAIGLLEPQSEAALAAPGDALGRLYLASRSINPPQLGRTSRAWIWGDRADESYHCGRRRGIEGVPRARHAARGGCVHVLRCHPRHLAQAFGEDVAGMGSIVAVAGRGIAAYVIKRHKER